jgi:radical SAM protein with 4Fe4S-binding SPASM domain
MTRQNIIFEVTTDCNLNCSYCYNHWKRGGPFERLNSYKQALKVLKRLFKSTDIKQVTFTGGEPFLGERFIELVLFCRMEEKLVSIITNGNGGKSTDYQSLISLGARLFQIPFLSAEKQVHDTLTNVNGSWDNAITSITDILSLGGFVVPVIVLTRKNHQGLLQTLAFLHEMGLDRVMLNRYNIGGSGIKEENLALGKAEINAAFALTNEFAKTNGMVITSNVCSPHCYINPSLYPNIGFGNCSPDVTRRPITLNIKGDVRLCNHSPIVAGNIFNENLDQILESDYTKQWAEIIPSLCTTCELYPRCMGGCRAASEQMGLTLAHADPIIEQQMGSIYMTH